MKTITPTTVLPNRFKLLLMGPPGSRKTTLGLQFPGVHYLDCDHNLTGPLHYLRQHMPNLDFTMDDLRCDDQERPIETHLSYARLLEKLDLFKTDLKYKNRRFVLLDSLSHVNEFIIRHTLSQQGKVSKKFEMEARDWTPFKSFAHLLLACRLEETNKPFICICHESKVKEPHPTNIMQTITKELEPFFQGAVGDNLGWFFTDVWRIDLRRTPSGIKAVLETQRTNLCSFLKNSQGMPAEIELKSPLAFKDIEPYLKGVL